MRKAIVTLFVIILCCVANAADGGFAVRDGQFFINGKPTPLYYGEMHYSRIPADYWQHRLRMMRAMGLNAVSTYVFWNYHETSPGHWDWSSGNHNLRRFIETAEREGLMVILRPGPYCCAEWEYGGYPWWLMQVHGMRIREYNQPFLDSCRTYINQLAAQVRDLQASHGGPVIMLQSENEFGSFVAQRHDIPLERHRLYSAAIRQMIVDAGFDVPLFTSDASTLFDGGTIDGALPTANGENDISQLKRAVNRHNGNHGPYVVAEFYTGWLDHWGEPFVKVPTEDLVRQTQAYLDSNINFGFYMVHGGTNFGFWSGANYSDSRNIQPDITSYDYDAPISEAGWPTEKYYALRKLLTARVPYAVPEVPERIPVAALPKIELEIAGDLLESLSAEQPVVSSRPLTFEALCQGYGYVLYSRVFARAVRGMMRVPGIADYATVYLNGKRIGILNRMTGCDSMEVNIPENGRLELLVENMGRINYGSRIGANHKGITAPITIGRRKVEGKWEMRRLPLDVMPHFEGARGEWREARPQLYHGTFVVTRVSDTFIDMSKWGKGIVFVNGHNLGRYWSIGPQQTLYVPGCWLREGENEVVVVEVLNDGDHRFLRTVANPIFD